MRARISSSQVKSSRVYRFVLNGLSKRKKEENVSQPVLTLLMLKFWSVAGSLIKYRSLERTRLWMLSEEFVKTEKIYLFIFFGSTKLSF